VCRRRHCHTAQAPSVVMATCTHALELIIHHKGGCIRDPTLALACHLAHIFTVALTTLVWFQPLFDHSKCCGWQCFVESARRCGYFWCPLSILVLTRHGSTLGCHSASHYRVLARHAALPPCVNPLTRETKLATTLITCRRHLQWEIALTSARQMS